MPRFVLLIHDHPCLHWDFLVQHGEVLQSWRFLESPDRWRYPRASVDLPAEAIGDHRMMYLDYEGPVSRERGRVACWDRGLAEWLERTPTAIQLRLRGQQLQGELTLDRAPSMALWVARFSAFLESQS